MTYKISPTLDKATAKFFKDFVSIDAVENALTDESAAKSLYLTHRTFHEGAFWAAARIAQVYEDFSTLKHGPESQVLKVVLEIMADYAKTQEKFESCRTAKRH